MEIIINDLTKSCQHSGKFIDGKSFEYEEHFCDLKAMVSCNIFWKIKRHKLKKKTVYTCEMSTESWQYQRV